MYSVILLAILAQPPVAEERAPIGAPPSQALAVIDAKGKMTIWHVDTNCTGQPSYERPLTDKKEKDAPKARVTMVMVTAIELPAKSVEAYTLDGKKIDTEKLAQMLGKERPVLMALDGKKVDAFHLQLFKEDTIVLVPPSKAVSPAFNPYGGGVPYAVPVPESPRPMPDQAEKPK